MGESVLMDGWYYDTLPNVMLTMTGRLTMKADADYDDEKKRSHFDNYFNWQIDKETDELVIRFKRKAEVPSPGHTNVNIKIEGGLSEQPDGSVVFDGGVGNSDGNANAVSKFALLFEISHESTPEPEPEPEPEEEEVEEPEEKEIKFFDHPEHKLQLAPKNHYTDVRFGGATCNACTKSIAGRLAKWVYECPDCNYCVHSGCALLPRTIRHPSHLQHTLKLCRLESGANLICDVCRGSMTCGLDYRCAKCDFDLHAECPDRDEDEGDDEQAVITPAQLQLRMMQQQMQQQMQLNMSLQTAACMANAGLAMSSLAG